VTICAPQQFSVLYTRIRTTSTGVHEAKDGDWKLGHLYRRSLSMTIGTSQQLSILNTKIRTTSTLQSSPKIQEGHSTST
jgi:hypothetical protein